jgi:flagellar protein FlgJ
MSTPIDLKNVVRSQMTEKLAARVKNVAAQRTATSAPDTPENSDDRKLRTACADFEAILVNRMLDAMRRTLSHDGLLEGGTGRDVYDAIYYQEMATRVTREKGMGIGETLYRQMAARAGAVPAPSESSEKKGAADKQ